MFRGDDEIIRDHPAWALHNSSGAYSVNGYAHNHVFDHRTPAAQVWIETCLNATRSGFVDGCFADAAPYGTMADCHDSALGIDCGALKSAQEYGLTNASGVAWVKAKEQSLWTLTTALGNGTLQQRAATARCSSAATARCNSVGRIPQDRACLPVTPDVHSDYGSKGLLSACRVLQAV